MRKTVCITEEYRMKKKKFSFSARERRPLELPESLFGDGPFIELRGRRELCIQGCKKILCCTPNTVCLALREGVLKVEGSDLICLTYFAGAMSIQGYIRCMSFVEAEAMGC